MAQELVVRVEGQPESESDVQESEHEIQEVETEAWRDALSNVTSELAGLNHRMAQALESQGTQSQELRALVETQRQMISDLMAANQTANAQLLETVNRLLTPPSVVVEAIPETQTETLPVVDPAALAVPVEERPRRFRAL